MCKGILKIASVSCYAIPYVKWEERKEDIPLNIHVLWVFEKSHRVDSSAIIRALA